MSRASPSLLDLNSDVLVHIFEELRPGRHLRPLSECSKSLRSLALPVLFRDCLVKMKKPITTGFLPRSLWPYVCCLLLVDACPVRTDPYSYSLRYTDDPMLCGTLDATVLRRSLPAMPRLKRVALLLHSREVHGIRADVAAAIFAAPQVRIIRISSFLFSPKQSLLPDSSQDLPPLTSFRYTKDAFREPPRAYPFEVDAIRLMLSKLHRSLEVLELPAEAAPLDVMSRLDWSRLQHLTLMGEFPSDSPTPLIDVIARMPCLRVLILRLAILRNMDRQCIWPPGWSVVNPLPEIEELVVTHPSPEDLLYTHLPQSIRRLSLCCSPCYALQVWTPDRYDRWISPLPAASELFRLLSASPLPRLEHLAIEYNPDDQEDDLWRFFSCAYPQLTSIEFHRMKLPPQSPMRCRVCVACAISA
ncbi:hypothetical protein C8T65DRAFT_709229 [Cerioporus squamosus]|nr:hypothetical protein C8T65DRAFT_709229 [Cerioporus squamosus]